MTKKALVTGVTGQDGAYLTQLLLSKGYEVHGLFRRSTGDNSSRLKWLLGESSFGSKQFIKHYSDLTDSNGLLEILKKSEPDEVYNLAAQSHVAVSFSQPIYTSEVDAIGVARILEAIRFLGLDDKTRFYQASTSELYGRVLEVPQSESTPFYPRSPYAVSKLYAYWMTVNYREAYNLYACNGILFNHESPIRGEDFVTRKITLGLARIKLGLQSTILLGNLDAKRDWGHARDYVEMQWLMLQQQKPEDFVISTGDQHSVREFVDLAAKALDMQIHWEGIGLDERGIDDKGTIVVGVSPDFYRPTEVETLLGNSKKAKDKLGWTPKTSFLSLVEEMAMEDLNRANQELQSRGG